MAISVFMENVIRAVCVMPPEQRQVFRQRLEQYEAKTEEAKNGKECYLMILDIIEKGT